MFHNIEVEYKKKRKENVEFSSNIPFGGIFSEHMFIMHYNEKEGWNNPKIVPYEDIRISPAAVALHYSQTVFEGLKAYKWENGEIALFRPKDNLSRLNMSCERICIPTINEDFLLHAIKKLISVDKDWVPTAPDTSLYVRPVIFATEANLNVDKATQFMCIVILSPSGPYYKTGLKPSDIYVESEYVRAVKGGMGMAKTGGNYAASFKAQDEAHKKGFNQILWLDGVERKYIEEMGAMNAFFVLDDKVITPMINGSILNGVTRRSVIDILKDKNINVEERRISIDEILEYNESGKLKEVFSTGTAAVIGPVASLTYNDKKMVFNDGNIGSLTKELYEELTGIQYGRIKDKFGWIETI